MKVYLAGGFRSGWQERVKKSCPQHSFFDPKTKSENNWNTDMIGTWDFYHIKQADLVFAYMERTNPSGFGLAIEIGYAKGIGKTVVLVLEEKHEIHKDKYLFFLKNGADITFNNFNEALSFILTFKND